MNPLRRTPSLILGALVLTGCASNSNFSGGRTWDDGWRRGEVTGVQNTLKWNQFVSCGLVAKPDDKFVVVSYRVAHRPYWRVIPMPSQNTPALQTKVLVNSLSCELVPDA